MRGVKYESVYKIAETMFFCSYVKKIPSRIPRNLRETKKKAPELSFERLSYLRSLIPKYMTKDFLSFCSLRHQRP